MQRILVLGAGRVARPLVRYLLDQPGLGVTVADQMVNRADALVAGHPDGTTVPIITDEEQKLEALIKSHDLTVSLLPAPLHPAVAEFCIKHSKHMVTASYVSPEMRALHEPAKAAGVMILNEVGLDPGIDHMSAMKIIHDVQNRGGKVVSFKSYCGGLPAPDCNDNPWGYKFSWSPRAVCAAGKNTAKYRLDGKNVHIPGPDLFADCNHRMHVEGVGDLEAYPNRDSLSYIDLYGLEGIETMFRGTLRYPGWCETLKKVVELGLLAETLVTYPAGTTYAEFIATLPSLRHGKAALRQPARFFDLERPRGLKPAAQVDVRKRVADRLGLEESSAVIERFDWLGLFSDDEIVVTGEETTPLDVLASRMGEKMSYREGEKDMVVLCHEFRSTFPEGPREHTTSILVEYGQVGGDSAMARTVGLPAAVAARHILTGKILAPGVHIPVSQDIYGPVLAELARMGIECMERNERQS